MKLLFGIVALSVSLFFAAPVLAVQKTVKLAVPGMTCPVCPVTVKKALSQVEGVNAVSVNFENKTAVVTFDDSKTTADALTAATTDAGYPSTVTP